jgi:hypothetical protein
MQKWYIVSLMAFLAVALLPQPQVKAETERVSLKEQFKVGQSFSAIEKMDLEVRIEAAENDLIMKLASGLGYRYTVKHLTKEGGKTVGLAIYSLYNDMPGGMGISNLFDSTDPFALPQANNLFTAGLTGQEIELEFRPDNTVSNVKFSDAFLDWILHCFKKKKTSIAKEQLQQQVLQMLEGQITKSDASLEQGIFPDKPVALGESWEKKVKLDNAGFGLTFLMTCQLKQRLNDLSLIEVKGKILGVGTESNTDAYEFRDLSGWLKGQIAVGEKDGWMHDFDLKFAIDGEIHLKPAADFDSKNAEAVPDEAIGAAGSRKVAMTKNEETGAGNGKTTADSTGKFHFNAILSRKALK